MLRTRVHVAMSAVAATLLFGTIAAVAPIRAAGGQTTPAAPVYDVRVDLEQPSIGTTTFEVDKTGKVTGKLHIESPNVVDATLGGTVKDGKWTFEYPFSMPVQGCVGTVNGTATVSADQSKVSGLLNIGGACVEQPVTAAFTFTRRAK